MRSVQLLAILGFLSSAAAAQAAPLFFDSFEHGTSSWYASDYGDVVTGSDSAVCSTSFQHETVQGSSGRAFTNSTYPATGGGQYCSSAWVRASADGHPFVAIGTFDANGAPLGYRWIIGDAFYDDGFADRVTAVTGDDAWHWYAASVTLDPATTSINVTDEMTGSGYADFDDISVTAGPCDTAYGGADQHEVCGNDRPVCGADGSCQALPPPPPADLGDGSPDMGTTPATGSGSFSGANQPMPNFPEAPSTPAASGAIAPGTNLISSSGGCSVGGSEGERSFAIMMLVFVGVMIAGRRRRA